MITLEEFYLKNRVQYKMPMYTSSVAYVINQQPDTPPLKYI